MKNIFIVGSMFLFVVLLYFYLFRIQDVTHSEALIVGINANYPPFEFIENGKFVGFEIELMQEIGATLNKEIIFKDMAFDTLLLEAQLGHIHIVAGAMTPTEARSKQIFFTKSYLEKDPLVIISLISKKAPENLADLKGHEVIVNDGFTAEAFMERQEGIILKRLESPAEAFFALKNGKADAFVSARSAVQPFFDRYGMKDFNVLTLPVFDSYALAVSKKYPEIFNEITHTLALLEQNGELKQLKAKWHLDF